MNNGSKRFALGRLSPGQMNRTETAYAAELEVMKRAGSILWYSFEGVKLRLADRTFYSPDFFIMAADGTLEVREVKGFWEEDARVKIKVAASMFPFRFVAVTKAKGEWKEEEF